jgi:hypothetical protein
LPTCVDVDEMSRWRCYIDDLTHRVDDAPSFAHA